MRPAREVSIAQVAGAVMEHDHQPELPCRSDRCADVAASAAAGLTIPAHGGRLPRNLPACSLKTNNIPRPLTQSGGPREESRTGPGETARRDSALAGAACGRRGCTVLAASCHNATAAKSPAARIRTAAANRRSPRFHASQASQ